MAINFPSTPSVGQEYAFGEFVYVFDGEKWTTKVLSGETDFVLKTGDTMTGPLVVREVVALEDANGTDKAVFGIGTGDIYVHNATANKYLQLKDDGTLQYSNNKIYHQGFKPTPADVGAVPNMGTSNGTEDIFTRDIGSYDINSPSTTPNWPLPSEGGSLFVQHHGAYRTRLATGAGSGDMYLSVGTEAEPKPWSRVYTSAFPPTSADVGAVSKTGDTMTGPLTNTTAGNAITLNGGHIRSNTGQVMSLDGSTYSFVTSPLDSHLCSNAYWDGTSWLKYDVAKASNYLVLDNTSRGMVKLCSSSPTSVSPQEISDYLYHTGFKPTAAEIGAAPDGYGLGGHSSAGHPRDFNQIMMNGWYEFNGDAGDTNIPTTYGNLLTLTSGNAYGYSGWASQLAIDTGGRAYIRSSGAAGSMGGSPWHRVYTTGAPPTAAEVGAMSNVNGQHDGVAVFKGASSQVRVTDTVNTGLSWDLECTTSGFNIVDVNTSVALNMVHNVGLGNVATFSGAVYAPDFYVQSDRRLKSEFQPIDNALDKVCSLEGQTYLKHGKREAGIIAQDLQEVLPEAVQENADGYLSVTTAGTIALLVEAVKELTARVKELENERRG